MVLGVGGCRGSWTAVLGDAGRVKPLFLGPSTSASAAAISVALGKRILGFFSMLCRIIADKAGEISGLMRIGGFGATLMCCTMISEGLFPWKGSVPVHISYRITPNA